MTLVLPPCGLCGGRLAGLRYVRQPGRERGTLVADLVMDADGEPLRVVVCPRCDR